MTEAVVSADFDGLPVRMAALCRYAFELTTGPWAVTESHVAALRRAGCSDRDVVDVNQVAAYFNYVNRVSQGLGVEREDDWPDSARAPRRYGIADGPG